MPKFMIKASYTAEGARGLLKEGGTGRRATIQKLIEGLGGKVEAFYFAYGEDDAYVICELPDNKAAATLAMTVSSSGRVAITTVPLLTVDEVDAVASGTKLEYSPPGT